MTTHGQSGQGSVIFGSGAPTQITPKGTKYYDDTATPYGEYVSTGAGWTAMTLAPCAVGSLPAAAAAYEGVRGTVTDSNAALTAGIGAIVAAGGANVVPVFCDGTNWRIG